MNTDLLFVWLLSVFICDYFSGFALKKLGHAQARAVVHALEFHFVHQ